MVDILFQTMAAIPIGYLSRSCIHIQYDGPIVDSIEMVFTIVFLGVNLGSSSRLITTIVMSQPTPGLKPGKSWPSNILIPLGLLSYYSYSFPCSYFLWYAQIISLGIRSYPLVLYYPWGRLWNICGHIVLPFFIAFALLSCGTMVNATTIYF